MRITGDEDSKKFEDDIEIPDAEDVELAPKKPVGEVVRSDDEIPFSKGYEPETLPKIDMPDLPEDAVSVSAQVLSEVPTLTELMPLAEIDESDDEDPIQAPTLSLAAPDEELQIQADVQVRSAEADKRAEIRQARMGKLSGQISSLNDKLDRLANSSKIKV
ncbi:hypothetical protein C5F52_18435 [Limnohabitans sp. TS-CS-82]|uniref:hypothetical protein n=1 Tax=Limnohabitans sp. TS-CS-82 TaxID=2094193 RepID=UPI000CF259AA|nr:hypothetical protein [Limnohabitans sp. TS-CS-82]PQA81569.1 hypothetical protein C5F52_18435 [Limnohabitans sp. TS-CS-82]